MDNKLSELKELAQMATPGPWGVSRDGMTVVSNMSHPIATLSDEFHRKLLRGETGRDAEFIAEFSPNFVLSLIDRLEAAEARVKEQQDEIERLNKESQNLSDQLASCDRERRSFRDLAKSLEAEIARRDEAAEPSAEIKWDGTEFTVQNVADAFSYGVTPVYTAPQPAVLPTKIAWYEEIEDVDYMTPRVAAQTYWNKAIAAAAALGCQPQKVVELPAQIYVREPGFIGWVFDGNEVEEALDAAGIPWKEKE